MKPMLSLLALVAAASLTSCLGEDKVEEKGTATYGGASCLNHVTDLQTGEAFVSNTPPSYKFDFNFTEATADIEMSNIQLAQNFSALSFILPTMKAEADYYYTKMQGTDLVPTNAASQYVVSKFLARYSNRVWNGNFYPVYQIAYTINNRYSVSVIPTQLLLFGTTTAYRVPGKDEETTETPRYTYRGGEKNYYTLQLVTNSIEDATATGATHTLAMRIGNAQFAEAMTQTDIVVDKLPVSITADGFVSKTEEGTTVTVKNYAGTEVTTAKIADMRIRASVSMATLVEFDIVCDGFQGLTGTYHVTANIDNFIIDENTDK